MNPIEQHMPLTGLLLLVVALHCPFKVLALAARHSASKTRVNALMARQREQAFIALFGFAPASFAIVPKAEPLPWIYIASVMGQTLLFEVLPYLEELVRGLRHRRTP